MKKNTKNIEQPDHNWQQFVEKGLVEKNIKSGDIIGSPGQLPSFSNEYPKDALKTLKSVLTEDAHRKLSGRWRKFKYTASHDNTTITIRTATLNRMKKLAEKSGLKNDSYDLLLEYLLNPEDELETHKNDDELLKLASGLDQQQHIILMKAKLSLRKHTWINVLNILDFSFRSGWQACKVLKTNKRTQHALDEAAKDYQDKVKGLEPWDKKAR
jgi:hypothetical protein